MSVYVDILKGEKVRTISVREADLKGFDYGLLSISGEVMPFARHDIDTQESLSVSKEYLLPELAKEFDFADFEIYI